MKRRRLLPSMLSLVMLVTCLTIPAFASTGNHEEKESFDVWSLETLPTGEAYAYHAESGKKIIGVWEYNSTGQLVEVPLSEYVQSQNAPNMVIQEVRNTDEFEPNEPRQDYGWVREYHETSTSNVEGTPVKVSADMTGSGWITHTERSSVTDSFGGDLSINTTLKNLIKLGATFSWNSSVTVEETNSYTFHVPAGEVGYVQFVPYMNRTDGEVYDVYYAPFVEPTYMYIGDAYGLSPIERSNGMADGRFELALR